MLNIQTGLNVRHWTFRSFLRHWADKLVFVVVSAWIPYKHATMGQYRASTGPMLAVSAQYWPIMACLQGPIYHILMQLDSLFA